MDPEEFKFLKDNRGYLRAKITRKCNSINSSIETYDTSQCAAAVAYL